MNSWLFKYCPQKIDDMLGQDSIKRALKTIIMSKGNNMPHLLLYGPSGTGKTLAIKLLTQSMYGTTKSSNVLYIRSINELGISTIRKDIKYFSQRSVNRTSSGVAVKLVVIEGADTMTSTAQAALRRIIETQSVITRFCLTCTDIMRIIDPIQSRCVVFRFKSIRDAALDQHLRFICEQEQADQSCVRGIVDNVRGDMRQAIVQLEANHRMMLSHDDNEQFVRWFESNVATASYEDMSDQIKRMFDAALSPRHIFTTLVQWFIEQDLDAPAIRSICFHASEIDQQIHGDGNNPLYLQYFLYRCKQTLLTYKQKKSQLQAITSCAYPAAACPSNQ